MTKILVRALKLAILPAALLITTKFLSVFTLLYAFNSQYSIKTSGSVLYSIEIVISNHNLVTTINSLSNLATLLVILLPVIYMVTRKLILQSAIENPRTVVKLTKLNLLKWITKDSTAILKVAVWTVFLWIASGICVSGTLVGSTYLWISVMGGIACVMSTWGLAKTFEIETAKIYPRDNSRYL